MSIQVKCRMVVSVSRRCDIPRFQFDWFMERLRAGFVETANPFNPRQIKRVSLLPAREGIAPQDGVEALVFWTRDPRHILSNAEELTNRGFPFYVMVTVTGYPAALEPNMPPAPEILSAMKELSRKIGADRVIWRYDPIVLTSITDENFHRENFKTLAQSLAGSVKRVIISIYDEYRGAKKRLEGLEKEGKLRLQDLSEGLAAEELSALLADLAKSAEAAGLEIQSCAEKEDFSSLGIKPGACIDAALIKKLCGVKLNGAELRPDKNQRPNCLCCKSVDIGTYGTCAACCAYCYALR